jgi:hypothetical protein
VVNFDRCVLKLYIVREVRFLQMCIEIVYCAHGKGWQMCIGIVYSAFCKV